MKKLLLIATTVLVTPCFARIKQTQAEQHALNFANLSPLAQLFARITFANKNVSAVEAEQETVAMVKAFASQRGSTLAKMKALSKKFTVVQELLTQEDFVAAVNACNVTKDELAAAQQYAQEQAALRSYTKMNN